MKQPPSIERRLEVALRAEADSLPISEGWGRIQRRIRWRPYKRASVLAVTLAVVLSAAVAPRLLRGDRDASNLIAPRPSGELGAEPTPLLPSDRDAPSDQGVAPGPSARPQGAAVSERLPDGAAPGEEGTFVPRAATFKPSGTYTYEMSGWICAPNCDSLRERRDTYERPVGSRQRHVERWAQNDGGKIEAEIGYDYRADGVYLETYTGTYTNNRGAVGGAMACPDLPASPARVWPRGAKPGDHFEYTVPCATDISGHGKSKRTAVDIIRAERISVGGREVVALFVREEFRHGDEAPYGTSEKYVLPDHYLVIKEHTNYANCARCNADGNYRLDLVSLDPS